MALPARSSASPPGRCAPGSREAKDGKKCGSAAPDATKRDGPADDGFSTAWLPPSPSPFAVGGVDAPDAFVC